MSEFEYKDYTPANARVIVDYKKEQKVSFSYPLDWSYKKAVWTRAYPVVIGWWLMIHMWPIFRFGFIFIGLYLGLFVWISLFPITYTTVASTVTLNFFDMLPVLIGIFYIFGIPAIITYFLSLKKERISKWMPIMGYKTCKMAGMEKETVFKPKDVKDNKVAIPVFSNVFLDYKCKGEFNNLEKVEVLEIPFNYLKKSWIPFKKKKEKNDWVYRALFYFSKMPKSGEMLVKFH